jgi:hypothetical protein
MKKQQLNEEFRRMQKLAGLLKEEMHVDSAGNLIDKNSYDKSFNAKKKYMENPIELVDMLEKDGVELDDEIYLFFDQSLSLDDIYDLTDEDTFKDVTLGKKENPNSPIRTNRNKWYNKELFNVIQNSDFIDSSKKIQEVLEFYYYQPFSMDDYFTTNYYDNLEEAREEWEEIESENRLLTYDDYKQLYDIYGEEVKLDNWN